jgi:hypothetical protein
VVEEAWEISQMGEEMGDPRVNESTQPPSQSGRELDLR